MKKSTSIFLFSLRLIIFFSVIFLITFHPAISVSFDRVSIIQWIIIVPFTTIIAYPKIKLKTKLIICGPLIIPILGFAGGLNLTALQLLLTGIISFTLSFLLFHHPRWAKPAILEPFFLAYICLRLLSFSRSSEEISAQGVTRFLFIWTGVIFLIHSAVIYFCLFPNSSKRAISEWGILGGFIFVFFLLVYFILPADFAKNDVISNLLSDRVSENIKSSDNDYNAFERDRGKNRRSLPRNDKGRKPGLRGISEHNWPDDDKNSRRRNGGAHGESQQRLVMVVITEEDIVYMGDNFCGQLDPVEGFIESYDESLNAIAKERFFVTWFNHDWVFDRGRSRKEIISLSTLPQKYLPYRPLSIDPVILNEDSGPLRYIHQVVSDMHTDDPLRLISVPLRTFNMIEENEFAEYLNVNLDGEDYQFFNDYLNKILDDWGKIRESVLRNEHPNIKINDSLEDYLLYLNRFMPQIPQNEYLEKLLAIMLNYSDFQYNIATPNYNKCSIEEMKYFLGNSKEGNCVEFGNSLALLGRLAGIPSRTVSGYLASQGLQSIAHLRGLAVLRSKIPFLRQFDFDNLLMVTNTHKHLWTQFYIPDYGWLDFDGTSFSIPPEGEGDFNAWDVVIPVIDDNKLFSPIRKFPWKAVLRAMGIIAAIALVCAYILRYGRELVLYYGARRGGRAGARSLYLLLLSKLAADGKPIKPVSKTALEYSELFPGAEKSPDFAAFAALYTELRWRKFTDINEEKLKFSMLKYEYNGILKTRRRGFGRLIIRTFSLRGLAYL